MKKILIKIQRKFLAIVLSFIMLSNNTFPMTIAFATDGYGDITVNATFNNASGEILINGTRVTGDREVTTYSGTATNVGYTDSQHQNQIKINTAFGENVAHAITINNVSYDVNGTDTNTLTVDGASTYTIVVDGEIDQNAPRTIIWANPGATDIDSEDAQINHGYAKIIAVYDENGQKLDYSNYTNQDEQPDGSKSDQYGLNKGNGYAIIKPGYKVVFEFTPEYGYQLTKVAANEQELAPQKATNQYTFTMPNANVHFSATFTKIDDIVKANSEKVESGSITLGNSLDGGTAQLSVSDVELGSDKISGFENAAGEYTISNYLDIDLYNVFYKGKADSNDVWSNKISELDNEATISLKLSDGVSADDIVIVHNIHDGDDYEIIKIESYDSETNTITFKTKSFSNYAIATKGKNPKTSDNVLLYFILLVIGSIGLGSAFILPRRKNLNRK